MSQISGKFIKTNTVTNTNLAQMATLTIKGNNTGGTANAADLTVAQVNAILPVFTSTLRGLAPLSGGGTTNFLRADGTWAAPTGTGTVTSVALADSTGTFTITGSPVTSSGTLTLSAFASQSAKTFLAAPTGGAGAPSFRVIAAADVPTLNQNTTGTASNVTGTVAIANGGTGQTSASAAFGALSPLTTKGDILGYDTANNRVPIGTNGQVLTADSSQSLGLKWATPTTGTVTSVALTVPAFLSVAGSPVTSSGTLAVTLSGTALPIANGGTAATTAAAAFNNLNPMTTTGDVIYESGTNTAARLAIGSTGQVLTVVGGVPAWATPAAPTTITENSQTGTSYTFVLGDAGELVSLSNSSTVTATVPTNASVAFPIGTVIEVISNGTGAVTVVGAGGVTVNSYNGISSLAGTYSQVTLVKHATNTWYMYGGLTTGYIVATGGSITTDGNFKVHTFNSSGTFQITSGAGAVDSLVIGGGGGGSTNNGGGGGGGQLVYTSPGNMYNVGSFSVTVGGGGAGSTTTTGATGGSSIFDAYTATGGLGGLSGAGNNGTGGASGSGNTGGAPNSDAGGGGGGNGANGSAAGVLTGGNGGNGTSNSITGSATTYAGGGGGGGLTSGGTGGTGGGGAGAAGSGPAGTNGTANTGGGGGGGSNGGGTQGGNGGSGVVILRYRFQN